MKNPVLSNSLLNRLFHSNGEIEPLSPHSSLHTLEDRISRIGSAASRQVVFRPRVGGKERGELRKLEEKKHGSAMSTFTPLSALPSRKKDVDEIISHQFRKELLSAPVTFVGARNDEAKFVAHKSKFVPINALKKAHVDHEEKGDIKRESKVAAKKSDILKMMWERVYGPSKGLSNFGNTCFMNSALQCLMNSAPLVQLLLEEEKTVCVHGGGRNGVEKHSSNGKPPQHQHSKPTKFCCYCELKKLVLRNYGPSKSEKASIQPMEMANNLRQIGTTFRAGRQEDSHEFIRELISKSDEAAAKHSKRLLDIYERPVAKLLPGEEPPPTPKPTSQLFALFGSFLRSRVTCGKCGYHSDTFDPYMDISVELTSHSLEHCLRHFTAPEQLDLDNMYKCGSCKKRSQPVKRIQLWQPPNLLTVHLKRFNIFGKKVNKEIKYPETLDLSPYFCSDSPFKGDSASSKSSTSTPSGEHIYRLYSVLLHHGPSSRSGHYTAVVKASNGIWMDANDSYMSKSSLKHALSHTHDAYILFYARESGAIPPTHNPSPSLDHASPSARRLSQLQDQFLKGDHDENELAEPSLNGHKKQRKEGDASISLQSPSHAKSSSPSTKSPFGKDISQRNGLPIIAPLAVNDDSEDADDSDDSDDSSDDSSSLGSSGDSNASDDSSEGSTESYISYTSAESDDERGEKKLVPKSSKTITLPNGIAPTAKSAKDVRQPVKLDKKARLSEAMKHLFGGHVPKSFVEKQEVKKTKEAYDAAIWKSKALYGGSQVSSWHFDSSPSPSPSMDVDDKPLLDEEDAATKARRMNNRAMGDLQLVAKETKKRARSAYDIDYDRGHVKKVKRKEESTPSSSGSYDESRRHGGQTDKNNKFQRHADVVRSGGKPDFKKNFKGGADRVKRLQQEEKKKKQFGGKSDGSSPHGGKKYFKKAFWKSKK